MQIQEQPGSPELLYRRLQGEVLEAARQDPAAFAVYVLGFPLC
jgi:hypothetical protein